MNSYSIKLPTSSSYFIALSPTTLPPKYTWEGFAVLLLKETFHFNGHYKGLSVALIGYANYETLTLGVTKAVQ